MARDNSSYINADRISTGDLFHKHSVAKVTSADIKALICHRATSETRP